MLYSRDAGTREASPSFHIGAGTQDLGFRSAVPILFDCKPATKVILKIRDVDGSPTTANFVIRDVKEPCAIRCHRDDYLRTSFFHDQIYRADGESVMLPPGDYSMVVNRGPEYRASANERHDS